MKVLVINSGSSSLKYQLFDMNSEKVLIKGLIERIGQEIANHEVAIKIMLDKLIEKEVISSFDEISAIGHRVVHGGSQFSDSVIIDEKVKETIRKLFSLAPLHNPPNLMGIESCEKIIPNVPQVAAFDTAFHQSLPEHAYLYGVAYEDFQQLGIRKYGFHGISHRYVTERAAAIAGEDLADLRIVSCHLGNGASVAAVQNGQSIDTSMGLTPLEGLIMGTRCGDLDPAVVLYLMEEKKLSIEETANYLNKKCGMLGVSGISNDFRDVALASAQGNKRAQVAIEMYCRRVKKYIGAYAAIMNGLDVLIFTAGLGENSPSIREKICSRMDYLGLIMDNQKNDVQGKEQIISSEDSKVKIMVIPTNEELIIARDAKELIGQASNG